MFIMYQREIKTQLWNKWAAHCTDCIGGENKYTIQQNTLSKIFHMELSNCPLFLVDDKENRLPSYIVYSYRMILLQSPMKKIHKCLTTTRGYFSVLQFINVNEQKISELN